MKTAHFYLEVDMTEASSESRPIRLNQLLGYSIASQWGASAGRTGTLKLQASNNVYHRRYKNLPEATPFEDMQEIADNAQDDPNAIWEDIPGSAKTVDATADQHVWNVDGVFYSAVRVAWVGTAGAEDPDPAMSYFHGKGNRN